MAGLDLKDWFERAKSARLLRVLLVYVIASWAVLQVIDVFASQIELPEWFFPVAVALLLVGLPIIIATALLQTGGPIIERGLGIDVPLPSEGGPWLGARQWLTWRRAILGGVLAFAALGGSALAFIWMRGSDHEVDTDVVAVLPFHVVGSGTELWRDGLVDLLSTALDATGQFRSSDPRAVLNRWRKGAGGDDELPEPAVAADVAGSLGAGRMILGSVIRTGPEELRVSADLYSVRWLLKEGTATVEGPEDEMTDLIDRLSVDLLKSVLDQESLAALRVSAITTTSPQALRFYLEGVKAYRESRFNDAENALIEAIEADSAFALAIFRLAQSYGWSLGVGAPEARRHFKLALRHSRGLPERDSLLILAWNRFIDGDLEAVATFEQLAARYPNDIEALYGLGEAHHHLAHELGVHRTSIYDPFLTAFDLDSTLAPALIHPVEVAISEDDTARVRRYLAAYMAQDSTSATAQGFEIFVDLQYGSSADSLAAMKALESADGAVVGRSVTLPLGGPATLGTFEAIASAAAANPQLPSNALGQAVLRLGSEYIRHGQVAKGIESLERGVTLWPEAPPPFAHSVVAIQVLGLTEPSYESRLGRLANGFVNDGGIEWSSFLLAQGGRLSEAARAVTRLEMSASEFTSAGDTSLGQTTLGLAWTLRGAIAAEQDSVDAAISHLRHGLSLMNGHLFLISDLDRYKLAQLLEQRGAEEEALRIYGNLYWTPWLHALGYLRRAELHDRRGENEEALLYYSRFVELWKDADARLQPQVESARRAMERLGGEGAAGALAP